jgi:hypothetical protein
MSGRRNLMPEISGGEITSSHLCSATSIVNGQTYSRRDLFFRCIISSSLSLSSLCCCIFLYLGPIKF